MMMMVLCSDGIFNHQTSTAPSMIVCRSATYAATSITLSTATFGVLRVIGRGHLLIHINYGAKTAGATGQ